MIDRYKTKEMEEIWNDKAKIIRWVKIEAAVASVMHYDNEIPDDEFKKMTMAEVPSLERINEIEKETDHDVVAFIRAYGENMGSAAKFLHKGLTSSDVVDTATSMAICNSLDIIIADFTKLGQSLKEKALKYKDLPCIGRTHGMHGEPTSFGLKFLSWYAEYERNLERLCVARRSLSRGKLSGAMGNYAHHSISFEKKVLHILNLLPEDVATQIIPRDRHVEVMNCISLIGVMIERLATEIRSLQRTEIGEVEENFKPGQAGSSAMPHKHNPILSERLCGLARLLRGFTICSYENVSLWHERDISHSSNERIIFPDAFHCIHYMIKKATNLVETLTIFEDKIKENIDKTHGLIFSQAILNCLISNGFNRTDSYKIIQSASQEILQGSHAPGSEEHFIELIDKHSGYKITKEIAEQMLSVMDPNLYLRNVDDIYRKLNVI